MLTEAQKKANDKYRKLHYKKILIEYHESKSYNERIKVAASKAGISKNAFILNAIEKALVEYESDI